MSKAWQPKNFEELVSATLGERNFITENVKSEQIGFRTLESYQASYSKEVGNFSRSIREQCLLRRHSAV